MYRWQITYTTDSSDEFVVAARLRVDAEDYMLFGTDEHDHGDNVRWSAPRSCVQSVTRLGPADDED